MDGQFLTRLALAACLAVAAARPAQAVAPPIIPDHQGASRVLPPAGLLGEEPTETVEDKGEEPEAEADDGTWLFGMHAHGRVIFIPDFILDAAFSRHPSGMVTASSGIGLELGTRRGDKVVLELDWTGGQLPDGNWLATGAPPFGAKYVDIDVHFLSLDFTYRGYSYFGEYFSIFYGGGLGLGGLVGKLSQVEVLPSCTEPIERCPHWRSVSFGVPDLPSPVWPVVHFLAGIQVELGGHGMIRLEGGFRNSFFLGLSAGFHL